MKIVGLLAWYEESPSWLAGTIASLMTAGVEHLVAVDGAYALFPGGRHRSGSEQHGAILETAHACGMGVTIHTPQKVWADNEIEKRSFLFRLAEQVSEPDDWYFVMDADQVVTQVPPDFRSRLEATECDVGEVALWERNDPLESEATALASRSFNWQRSSETRCRFLFRAVPGLTVQTNHYTYIDGLGRRLWGNPAMGDALEPAGDFSDLRIEHRTKLRDQARILEQRTYYKRRDALQAEFEACKFCDQRAVRMVPYDFELSEGNSMTAGNVQVCADHVKQVEKENEEKIASFGLDPELVMRG